MPQGKIERYHRSMKNVVKPQTFYFPWELGSAISEFVRGLLQPRAVSRVVGQHDAS
jgi:hypothetical protein